MSKAVEIISQSMKEMKVSTEGSEFERTNLVQKLNDAGLHNTAQIVDGFKPSHSEKDWYPVLNSQLALLIGVLTEAKQ